MTVCSKLFIIILLCPHTMKTKQQILVVSPYNTISYVVFSIDYSLHQQAGCDS